MDNRKMKMRPRGTAETYRRRRKYSVSRKRRMNPLNIGPEVTHKKVTETIALRGIVTPKAKNFKSGQRMLE